VCDSASQLCVEGLLLEILAGAARQWSIERTRREPQWLHLVDGVLRERFMETLTLDDSMLAEVKLRYPGPHKRDCFLFVGDDGLMPPDDRDLLRFQFRPILKRLGLYYPGFGWHAFRRQNITWRQQVAGATLPEAQKAARHASLDMTYLYTLKDAERETSQQQAMFDYLFGRAEGPKM
jgi:hypothetical protein